MLSQYQLGLMHSSDWCIKLTFVYYFVNFEGFQHIGKDIYIQYRICILSHCDFS